MVTSTDTKDIFHVTHHIHLIMNIKLQKMSCFSIILYLKRDGYDGYGGLP